MGKVWNSYRYYVWRVYATIGAGYTGITELQAFTGNTGTGLLDGWTFPYGNAAVCHKVASGGYSGGHLWSSIGNSTSPGIFAIKDGISGADGTVSSRIYTNGDRLRQLGSASGLVGRYKGGSGQNFYLLWVTANNLYLFNNISGAFNVIAGPYSVADGWQNYELIISGTSISAKYNGSTVLSTTDSNITGSGNWGIRSDFEGLWDDLSINVGSSSYSNNFDGGSLGSTSWSATGAYTGSSPGGQGPSAATDGNLDTVWIDWGYSSPSSTPTGYNDLYLDAGADVALSAYRYICNADIGARDPSSFALFGAPASSPSSYTEINTVPSYSQYNSGGGYLSFGRIQPTELFETAYTLTSPGGVNMRGNMQKKMRGGFIN